MTNKEFYRRTFSQVHPSAEIRWEDMENEIRWEGLEKGRRKKPLLRRFLPVAAAAALLIVFSGGAVATNFFGLRDVLLPKDGDTPDIVSLSGAMDTPESQALAEWQDFLDQYDPDNRILQSVGSNITELDSKYRFYGVYSQEMADRLEEIAAKYGLKLHTDRADPVLHPEVMDSCGDYLSDNITPYYNCIYEDGTFFFDGDATLPGHVVIGFQFRRSVKGSFNDVILSIEDALDFQQWTYKTASGVEVVLASGSGKGLLFADLPDCFVTCNVLSGISQADLKALADSIDFAKLTPVVPPDLPTESAPVQVDRTAREHFVAELKDMLRNYALPDGSQVPEPYDAEAMARNQFAVYDVDGDGQEELIVLFTNTITAGMTGYILAFDPTNCALREQLTAFPGFTFCDGSAVKVDWSHNQGLAGDALWPYTLYRHDPISDKYVSIAQVDAWAKSRAQENYAGEPFPDDIDADGDGVIYYVTPEDENQETLTLTLDGPEYQDWWRRTVGDDSTLDIPYQAMTEENINALLVE